MGLRIERIRNAEGGSSVISDRDLFLVDGEILEAVPPGKAAIVAARRGRPIPPQILSKWNLPAYWTETTPDAPEAEPVHLGGGWYQLADGSKVRGKPGGTK